MDVPAPSKPVLALVAAGLVVATITTLVLVVSKDDDPDPSAPAHVDYPEPERPKARPSEPKSKVPAAPTEMMPVPSMYDAQSAAAEVTEMLVLSRRIESTDPARARMLLLKVLALDPENETALARASNKVFVDEKHASVRQLVERCLKVNPSNSSCQAINAQLPNEAAMEAAVKSAQECTERTPDDADCIYTLLDNAFQTDKKDAAALIALRLHQVAPEAPQTKYALGRTRAVEGKYADAKALFDAACKLGNQPACFRSGLLRQEGF
jgi:hypothetical protein